MRTLASAAAMLATLTSAPFAVPAQGTSFEGTVTFETRMDGEVSSFAYSMKGSRIRFEPRQADMPMYMLMNPDEPVVRMVMIGQNAYMEMAIPDADDASDPTAEPKNTGRTDEVAGRKCEIWTMTDQGEEFEMCIARNMGTFMQGGGPMSRTASPAWQRELRKGGFFPLRIKTSGGDSQMVMVATKIEEKKLDDSFFDVPAGAKKMSMPPGMGRRP